ncbi:hypothetical protein O181_026611 [Austropuccinia psidii MF-1]|uniref:Uncharacterized protein n=1 Tax=Austropuccinia psidii MF-1 TaxID=1389203 RepID=A0A9Q3H0N8_9BASI|nr:hypothetical protein [Austropuccinia psidii MF-1]
MIHLATSLCLEPVTNSKCQYHNQSRKPPHLQLEYPEVPSAVGVSEAGNSLPKGPSLLLHKYHLTLGIGAVGHWQGFIPNKAVMALTSPGVIRLE